MAENNLNYTETLKLIEKELLVLGSAFSWVYAHYSTKRSFFFSILKCQSFFNVSFRNRSRKTYAVRWGDGIKIAYPAVKIIFRAYIRELRRHPFFRVIDERERKKVFNLGFKFTPFISVDKFLKKWAQTGELGDELFNKEKRYGYRLRTKHATRTKFKRERGFGHDLDRVFLTQGWSNANKQNIIMYKGPITELKKQGGRKNNIWSRLTGGYYLAARPGILSPGTILNKNSVWQVKDRVKLSKLILLKTLSLRRIHSVRDAKRAKRIRKKLRIRWLVRRSKKFLSIFAYRRYYAMKRRLMGKAKRIRLLSEVNAAIAAKIEENRLVTRLKKKFLNFLKKLLNTVTFGYFSKKL